METDHENMSNEPVATSLQDAQWGDILSRAEKTTQTAERLQVFHHLFGQLPLALVKRIDQLSETDTDSSNAWRKLMRLWHELDDKQNR